MAAVSTPPGKGGVGCVRISGPDAVAIARHVFRPRRGPGDPEPGCLRFGRFLGKDGRAIDHGYLVILGSGASYTGEPTAELWAHGSPAVLAELVAAAVAAGGELAGPGEFTYRALRHGRLDLARAEAVRDLIAARTLYQARLAFAQAEGALSRRVTPLREALEDLMARAEAALEFVDESETHLPHGELERDIEDALQACESLLGAFRAGRLVREGATLVITGLPNVGKSSLFNRLLGRDRAIVAAQPGTTRDTLEESLDLAGIPLRVVDTAGLRHGGDPVEDEGVRRAHEARTEADLLLLVLDASRPLEFAEVAVLEGLRGGSDQDRTIVVVNKVDLLGDAKPTHPHADAVRVSAWTGEGMEDLRGRLKEKLIGAAPLEDPILTNVRHARALEEASTALRKALRALEVGFTEEVALEDLREAMRHVAAITGPFSTDDLYHRIFSTFCIGK